MKKFITTISLQIKDLQKRVYKAVDNPDLQYDKAVSFPIISAINCNVSKGDKIKIYAIIIGNGDQSGSSEKNYEIFAEEISEAAEEIGFSYEIIKIYKDSADDVDAMINLFSKMIDIPQDGDELSACITYGTKPIPVITIMALHYSYKIKENIDIKNIVYGNRLWGDDKYAEIFDVTPLFYIDSAIENIARLKLENPETFLRSMLGKDE